LSAYRYDSAGRLASLTNDLGGRAADQVLGFEYNAASQIVARTGSNDALASATAYNVGRSYSVNGLNQYTSAGPAAFAYDANGNLTSDGTSGCVHDAENRLVSRTGGIAGITIGNALKPIGHFIHSMQRAAVFPLCGGASSAPLGVLPP